MSALSNPAGRSAHPTGLRARQKQQTRDKIRTTALRLFTEQGYDRTTFEQIAHEATVSHMTIFRYFATKEDIIIGDDLDKAREALLKEIPAGLGAFDLLRHLVTAVYGIVTADPWASNLERINLIESEPALRAASQAQADKNFTETTRIFADHTGRDPDDFVLRVFVAATSGVLAHVARWVDDPLHRELWTNYLLPSTCSNGESPCSTTSFTGDRYHFVVHIVRLDSSGPRSRVYRSDDESSGTAVRAVQLPLMRFGSLDEAGAVLAFCASKAPGYLTGTDILVDGGTRAGERFK